MKNKRRDFLRLTSLASLTIAGGIIPNGFASGADSQTKESRNSDNNFNASRNFNDENLSIIGIYGQWAASLIEKKLPSFSFRRKEWSKLETWRKSARKQLLDRIAIPPMGAMPKVKINRQYSYDGLHIEELSWQLPYGRPTEAILLKPLDKKGRLPGILAFHDHGGNKYFGTQKITRTGDSQHPLMQEHQREYYENFAWANEIAKRGYVVLVPDAFLFASRRVLMNEVHSDVRREIKDPTPEDHASINAYNQWAGNHEHVIAKSLFSAGTTWPGVFFGEDKKALDVLCAREDVDVNHIGCGGLSGGGLRTVFMGGLDPRIKCAVCVGFMSTWKDFIMNKSFTHTWMTYVPLLPNELEFPEILGLRVPLSTLVLNDSDDWLYTLPEMKKADKILQEVYKKADADDRYRCSYYPGPHKFDAKMQAEAFEWFDRWLK